MTNLILLSSLAVNQFLVIKEYKKLNLEELEADFNPLITDLNHMTNLRILSIDGNSGVSDKGIRKLNLISLYANKNNKITDLNHMTNLRILQMWGNMR